MGNLKKNLGYGRFAVDYNLSGDGEVGIYQNGFTPWNEFLNLGWLNFKTADKSKEIKRDLGAVAKKVYGFYNGKIQKTIWC